MSGAPTPVAQAWRPLPVDGLPAPRPPDGAAAAACVRASCLAIKRRMLALVQDVEALTQERDALRTALDAEWGVDWTALGGEEVARQLTPTEGRLVAALLRAGREAGAAEFRTLPHARILREVWGPQYLDAQHLARVTMSRLRQKLHPLGWDVVAWAGVGYRLAPFDPERRRTRAPLGAAERADIAALRAGGLGIKRIARRLHRDVTVVRRVLREAAGAEHA